MRTALAARLTAATGDLTPGQLAAALRWRHDWLLDAEQIAGCSQAYLDQGHQHAAMLARAAASCRCRAVGRCLGEQAEDYLRLLLIEAMSPPAIARVLMPNDANGREKVIARLSLLFDILASHYAASGVVTTD